MIKQTKIALIGAGNMGHALGKGFLKQHLSPWQLFAADPKPETCQALESEWGIQTSTDNTKAVEFADYLILAVKPQQAKAVLTALRAVLSAQQVIISIAAGITCEQIATWVGNPQQPIIRAMPNTPALYNQGITALYKTASINQAQADLTESLLSSVGETVWISKEELMNVVTALSGSGPAYFFYLFEGLVDAAHQLGLPKETAKRLCLQTALGSVTMAMQSDLPLSTLREQVTSKGGTTECGLQTLKAHDFLTILQKTLTAATLRGQALSKQED